MTEAQKFHFYFPAWTACVKANGWRKEKGRLQLSGQQAEVGDQTSDFRPPTSEELAKVLTFATQRALTAGRSLTVDDLRHGCHVLALGRDKSSEDLTNTEVDRVVCLFKLLADPDDLTARLAWDAYERGEDPGAVKRVEYFIRKCPDAYVRAVSHGLFGTRTWENLTVAQKRRLSMTLANRKPAVSSQRSEASHPTSDLCPQTAGHVPDPDNEPF